MADKLLYGTAGNVALALMSWAEPKDYLIADPVVLEAEIKIMKDNSGSWISRSSAGATTFAEGFLIIPLDITDTTCKDLMVKVVDTVTKVYVDTSAIFETFGNVAAKHFDATQTSVDAIGVTTTNTKAETALIYTEVQNYGNYKADVSTLALQGTLTTVGAEVTVINGKIDVPQDLGTGADLSKNMKDIYDAVIAGSGGLTPTQEDQLFRTYVFTLGNFSADVNPGDSSITDYTYTIPGEDPDVDTPVFIHNLEKISNAKSKRTVTITAP